VGHEERFPPTRLSAGCGFRKETIARIRRNGRDAPIPAVRATMTEPLESTHNGGSSRLTRSASYAQSRHSGPDR